MRVKSVVLGIFVLLTGCESVETGGMCSSSFACGGDDICYQSTCVNAYNREYIITMSGGTAPQRKADGAAWDDDGLGNLPDLYGELYLAGKMVKQTGEVQDNLTATWNSAVTITLAVGATLEFKAYDSDALVDDLVSRCAIPVTGAMLRLGSYSCTDGGGAFQLMLLPK